MKKIKFTLIIMIGLSFMLSSCTKEEEPPLERNLFKTVLKDLHIADGVVNAKNITKQIRNDKEVNIYSFVLKKHKVNRMDLETTISYYAMRPDKYIEIYKEISKELKEIDKNIKLTVEVKDNPVKDKNNLWKRKTKWELPDDGKTNPITFKLEKPEHGEYTLSANIKLFPDDGSISQRMTILVQYDDGTQEENSVGNIKKDGKYYPHKVFIHTDTSRNISRITCWVLNHSQGTSNKHASVKDIKLTRKAKTKSK